MKNCIIACRVFEDALRFLEIPRRFPDLQIRYLPAHLHLRPDELRQRISLEIAEAHRRKERACCLFGQCFPGIDTALHALSVPRIACSHCFEIFLGTERYRQMTEAVPGSFFLEKRLLLNFDEYCWQPLELYDPMMRSWYFEHYRRVIYIRQPLDPDLMDQARHVASRLSLSLHVEDADYTELEAKLVSILETDGF